MEGRPLGSELVTGPTRWTFNRDRDDEGIAARTGQIFFTTDTQPDIDEARSVCFDVDATPPGGAARDYVIDLGPDAGWAGCLDPAVAPRSEVQDNVH